MEFPGGVWPVMLTPFTVDNQVDYPALKRLTEWYINNGVSGLFAVCQSSEMFYLSLEERTRIARTVVETAGNRVPVVASGHISDDQDEQVNEIIEMSRTGVDAVIMITNRFGKEGDSEEIWINELDKLLSRIPDDIKLGLYECPFPYKRVLSREMTKHCVECGRFYFLKDTSCDIDNISEKLSVMQGSHMKLYNANTATLLESLRVGAYGYSGVMANMQCQLYNVLCRDYMSDKADHLSDLLTICALIERQCYPVNAKYYQSKYGCGMELISRVKNCNELTATFKKEVDMLHRITDMLINQYN